MLTTEMPFSLTYHRPRMAARRRGGRAAFREEFHRRAVDRQMRYISSGDNVHDEWQRLYGRQNPLPHAYEQARANTLFRAENRMYQATPTARYAREYPSFFDPQLRRDYIRLRQQGHDFTSANRMATRAAADREPVPWFLEGADMAHDARGLYGTLRSRGVRALLEELVNHPNAAMRAAGRYARALYFRLNPYEALKWVLAHPMTAMKSFIRDNVTWYLGNAIQEDQSATVAFKSGAGSTTIDRPSPIGPSDDDAYFVFHKYSKQGQLETIDRSRVHWSKVTPEHIRAHVEYMTRNGASPREVADFTKMANDMRERYTPSTTGGGDNGGHENPHAVEHPHRTRGSMMLTPWQRKRLRHDGGIVNI